MQRRPFRPRPVPPRRRPRRHRRPVVSRSQRMLVRAQRYVEQEKYLQAAEIYDRLAQGAYARARVRPGIHMDLEAARCYLQGADLDAAKARVLRAGRRGKALGLVYPRRGQALLEQVAQRLEATGRAADAAQLRTEAAALLGDAWAEREVDSDQRSLKRTLPGSCPACSAPLHPDSLTWVAEDRVTCPYCGSVVIAE